MRSILLEYVNRNKKNFIIIITLFCIGIAVGICFINNSDESQKLELNNYVGKLVTNIKQSETINKMDILFVSIKQNVSFILLIWFLGCTIIGGFFIYIMIIYKGFTIGYTISAIIAVLGIKHGTIFSISSLLFQNLIFLPAFFIIAENRYKIVQRYIY